MLSILLGSLIPLSFIPYASAGITFTDKSTLIQNFKDLCDTNSTIADYVVIGQSYEGKDIYLFRIGNPNGGAVMWDGSLHGWEDIGSEIMYHLTNWLMNNNSAASNRILENNYVLFVPIVNMDSVERGNRDFANDAIYGVDLNRNFVTGFSYISSPGTSSSPYHGAYGGSEPETQAMISAFETYDPEIYVNTHYGGGPLLQYSGTNSTLTNWIIDRMEELSTAQGFECPWSDYLSSGSAGSGYAIADAKANGANTWMWEVADEAMYHTGPGINDCYMHNIQTLADIENWYFPRCIPVLEAMCEAVEIDTPYPTEYTLTVAESAGGSTSPVAGEYVLDADVVQNLTATAADGYDFVDWKKDGVLQEVDASWNITMDDDYTVQAVFSPESTPIPPEAANTYSEVPISLVETINGVPAKDIKINGVQIKPSATVQYALTVSASTGGTTDPTNDIYMLDVGTNQSLTATPSEGWSFVDWKLDDELQNVSASWYIIMDANYTVEAIFSHDNWLEGYDNRIPFNITDDKISANLTKFPVLLTISNSAGTGDTNLTDIFTELTTSSRKLAITSSDGTTEVTNSEVELWNNGGNAAYVWAALNLTDGQTNSFYLYFDKDVSDNALVGDDPNDAATNNVWDSNYMMVQHLQGASYTAIDDSSSNNNDVTTVDHDPDFNQPAKIGNGVHLDRISDEWLGVADANTLDGFSEATWEYWFSTDTIPITNDKRMQFGKYNPTSNQRSWAFSLYNNSGTVMLHFLASTGGTSGITNTYTWNPSVDTLYQITLRWDSSTATTPVLYINGEAKSWTSSATITSALYNSTDPLYIGSYYETQQHDGFFDEMRISNLDRGAEYVIANYLTQTDAFVTWGDFET